MAVCPFDLRSPRDAHWRATGIGACRRSSGRFGDVTGPSNLAADAVKNAKCPAPMRRSGGAASPTRLGRQLPAKAARLSQSALAAGYCGDFLDELGDHELAERLQAFRFQH